MSAVILGQSQNRISIIRATVRSNKDPKKLGRIQVSYPHHAGNTAAHVSEWARIVQPYSSKDNGSWFVPDIDDEVLVLIDANNPEQPTVLGTFYNERNTPPASGKSGDYNDDGKNHLKFIKTRSGNLLCFDDTPGQEEILVKEKSGAQLKLAKNKIALGNDVGEVLDLVEQVLDAFIQNASTLVSTAVGPGVLNPSIVQKATEVKQKLSQMKGKL